MIYVMRHGESTANIDYRINCGESSDLTEAGRDQARKAAHWFQNKGIQRVYSSPYPRARQTASIIAETLDLILEIDDDLRELDCGEVLEGHVDEDSLGRFMATFRRFAQGEWAAQFPGRESYRSVFERFSRILSAAEEENNTLLVTHGGVIRAIVPFVCVNAAVLQGIRIPENTGLVILEPYDIGRYICESWNLVDHLAGD